MKNVRLRIVLVLAVISMLFGFFLADGAHMEWNWRNTEPTHNTLFDAAYGNYVFMAAGQMGTPHYSYNGRGLS